LGSLADEIPYLPFHWKSRYCPTLHGDHRSDRIGKPHELFTTASTMRVFSFTTTTMGFYIIHTDSLRVDMAWHLPNPSRVHNGAMLMYLHIFPSQSDNHSPACIAGEWLSETTHKKGERKKQALKKGAWFSQTVLNQEFHTWLSFPPI
jgi:hypothetical protein